MIGHRGEVKGMGVVVRDFLLSKLFRLSHSWFNFVLGSILWPARSGELLSPLFPARGLRRLRGMLQGIVWFGFCVSKRILILFVHVPRHLPSVPPNRSCYGTLL